MVGSCSRWHLPPELNGSSLSTQGCRTVWKEVYVAKRSLTPSIWYFKGSIHPKSETLVVSMHVDKLGFIGQGFEISVFEISTSTQWRWLDLVCCAHSMEELLHIHKEHVFPETLSLSLWIIYRTNCEEFLMKLLSTKWNSSYQNCIQCFLLLSTGMWEESKVSFLKKSWIRTRIGFIAK